MQTNKKARLRLPKKRRARYSRAVCCWCILEVSTRACRALKRARVEKERERKGRSYMGIYNTHIYTHVPPRRCRGRARMCVYEYTYMYIYIYTYSRKICASLTGKTSLARTGLDPFTLCGRIDLIASSCG